MNTVKTFSLIPFERLPEPTKLSITGSLTRTGDLLSITYILTGALAQVQLPSLNVSSERTNYLWEKTCLEFFLTANHPKQNQDPYWEFNLSPTGNWNVFALESYRQGLKEETAFTALPFTLQKNKTRQKPTEGLQLDISMDLGTLLPASSSWTLGISAIILLTDGTETFWALSHPTPTADFHSYGSFAMTVSA